MKKLLAAAVSMAVAILACAAPGVRTQGARLGEWTQDVEAARKLSRDEGRYLFLNFTGSDWCGWCKLMDEHVFSQPGWREFAERNLALAFIDFPREKSRVPEEFRTRNRSLQKEYGVKGYPTFVVCAPDGHVAGRLGAVRSGNDYGFVTNVVAVFVEDSIASLVTAGELAEYREALLEKAAWESDNAKLEADFKRDFMVPHDKAVQELEKVQMDVLRKAADAFGATTGITPKEQIEAVETLLARRHLKDLVSAEDLAIYEEATRRRSALAARWAKDYDAFIAETDRLVERFKPIAEKRNRVFEKAMKAYLSRNPEALK